MLYAIFCFKAAITKDSVVFRDANALLPIYDEKITDIEKIEYEKGSINENGQCVGWPMYKIYFKDGSVYYSENISTIFPENGNQVNRIIQYLTEKSGKSVVDKGCLPFQK
jgi:hypothetical protein